MAALQLELAALQLVLAARQLSGGDPATVRCRPCEEQNRLCAFPRGGRLLDRGDSCVFLMKRQGVPGLRLLRAENGPRLYLGRLGVSGMNFDPGGPSDAQGVSIGGAFL